MRNVQIILRVFNRVEDLEANLQIIRNNWKRCNYHITIVCNGKEKGYGCTDLSLRLADEIIELKYNAGHLEGNSQLLTEACKNIQENCEYTILII